MGVEYLWDGQLHQNRNGISFFDESRKEFKSVSSYSASLPVTAADWPILFDLTLFKDLKWRKCLHYDILNC